MRGGQHIPFQPPCSGTVLAGVGPRYQHKKSSGVVPAVYPTYRDTNGTLFVPAPGGLKINGVCGSTDTICTEAHFTGANYNTA